MEIGLKTDEADEFPITCFPLYVIDLAACDRSTINRNEAIRLFNKADIAAFALEEIYEALGEFIKLFEVFRSVRA